VTVNDVFTGGLLVAGAALLLVGCLGVSVMRSHYDRLHYTGPAAYGAALVGLAVLVRCGWSLMGDKALAVAVVLVVTGPVLTHATARSARRRDFERWQPGDNIEVIDP
jgi:multicomponent Na+:H+ antiporter subunit G